MIILLAGLLSSPARAADPVVVAVLPFVSSSPVFLAESWGYYRREGLEVELRFFQAAQPVALAVAAGDADIGVTGLTAGFYNLAVRGAVKIVAGQARVEPGWEFVAYVTSPTAWSQGVRSLEDLDGRKVGITQVGSTFHYMVGQLADAKGFPLENVRLIPLESVANTIAALQGGGVDAILLPAHLARPLVAKGKGRILGWASEVAAWQLGALFASTDILEDRPEVVERFLRAYRDATKLYSEAFLSEPDADTTAGARELARELTEFIPSTVDEIVAGAPYIPADGALDVAGIRRHVAWFQARGLVDRRLDSGSLFLAPAPRRR